ncbi:hypothetical protein D3C76_1791950 [compost metagenome]
MEQVVGVRGLLANGELGADRVRQVVRYQRAALLDSPQPWVMDLAMNGALGLSHDVRQQCGGIGFVPKCRPGAQLD